MTDKQYLADNKVPELINNITIQLMDALPSRPRRFLANAILEKIDVDTGFPNISTHTSTMAQVLTPEMFSRVNPKRTTRGWTIDNCIRPGVDYSSCKHFITSGCVAGDEESYTLFAPLFDAVIEAEQHFKATDTHKKEQIDSAKISGAKFDNSVVLQSTISAQRNLQNFPLAPLITRRERREIEQVTVEGLKSLLGQLLGKYFGVYDMKPEQYKEWVAEKVVFEEPDCNVQYAAGLGRDWPDARGVFMNDAKNLLVWVNNENHIDMLSTQPGGDLMTVYARFCDAMTQFEAAINKGGFKFMETEHHGHITSVPSNIGTAMQVTVTMQLPNLMKHQQFDTILNKLKLRCHETKGAHAGEGVTDVCNTYTIGASENEIVQLVADGVEKLVTWEKRLAAGEDISGAVGSL